jgi:hypothetical protein
VIREEAAGPGLIDPEVNAVVGKLAFTDQNGEFSIVWEIDKFGQYTTRVTGVYPRGSESAMSGTLDDASTTTSTYTVSQVCATPEPAR